MPKRPDRRAPSGPAPAVDQPSTLWRLMEPDCGEANWHELGGQAREALAGLPVAACENNTADMVAAILTEKQFGPRHFEFGALKQIYYRIRPALPIWTRPFLHRLSSRRQRKHALLEWPIEDRYVNFQFQLLHLYLSARGAQSIQQIRFWPAAKRFALVLTHDVESAKGQQSVVNVADLDQKYGFRSSFNFVPEHYKVEGSLFAELRSRGFEVGVHGLRHDGRLFMSRRIFEERVPQINEYLRLWGAVGFRSPFTHRNPHWMQALEIEYDSSFFDTDPFEPIAGGTMSIWPFRLGRFIELPYTLAQDHTLMHTLAESTPRLWLEKVDFIRRFGGMALVNVHPDYLRKPAHIGIYEEFLDQMRRVDDYWHALPRDVARWWKLRSECHVGGDLESKLPGATLGTIRTDEVT
jgi:hypothetical protein